MKINTRKFLICGDSLTDEYVGWIDGLMWDYGIHHYGAIVSKTLDVPYINTGVSGDTIANIYANIQDRIIKHNPSFVFLEGGVNDCGLGTTAKTVKDIMRNAIQTCLDNGIQVGLIYYPVDVTKWNSSNGLGLPAAMQELAAEFSASNPDDFIFFNFEGDADFGTTSASAANIVQRYRVDGLHFNIAGLQKVAEGLLKRMYATDASLKPVNKGSRMIYTRGGYGM